MTLHETPAASSSEWATPQELFDVLDAEFRFTLDPCALPCSAKCERYFTPEDDGLAQDWDGVVFMNPPYGRAIGAWVKKSWEELQRGATVVCLFPARTDTAYWHDFVMKADEVRFIRGRLSFVAFGGQQTKTDRDAAPFGSAIVVFRGEGKFPRMLSVGRDGR